MFLRFIFLLDQEFAGGGEKEAQGIFKTLLEHLGLLILKKRNVYLKSWFIML